VRLAAQRQEAGIGRTRNSEGAKCIPGLPVVTGLPYGGAVGRWATRAKRYVQCGLGDTRAQSSGNPCIF